MARGAALGEPVRIGSRTAPSRVLFGPHVTNLGHGRAFSARHRAYYSERAAGGCGVVVCETVSVHPSDHPYERAPVPGWSAVAGSCGSALLLASLGHSGSQGTSAFTGQAIWGASRVPDVVSREVPQVMEQPEIDALVAGFARAAARAVADGLDGVEIEAGQHSLLRQFLSGLTNHRTDRYGTDRGLLLREVVAAVRAAVGDAVVGLRLCVDELAPWAGITPESTTSLLPPRPAPSPPTSRPPSARESASLSPRVALSQSASRAPSARESASLSPRVALPQSASRAPSVRESASLSPRVALSQSASRAPSARESGSPSPRVGPSQAASRPPSARESGSEGEGVALADLVDYLVPVRGSGLSVPATRPDLHTPPGFLRETAGRFLDRGVPVVLAGSVVDPAMAGDAVDEGFALVEMTRAQIADPLLVAHVRAGRPERIRPCTLAQQHQARDPRNPLVGDEAEPRSGHETVDPALPVEPLRAAGPPLLVVGGGPAGMEAARTAALLGRPVRLVEQGERLGGALRYAALLPGRARFGLLVEWWERELARLGVEVCLGVRARQEDLVGAVVLATGSVPGETAFPADVPVLAAAEFEAAVAARSVAAVLGPGARVLVHDPVGDWTGVGVAEQVAAAGLPCALVTPDAVAGTQLARTGDLADANARLERLGVERVLFSRTTAVVGGQAQVVDVHHGGTRAVPATVVVDCGYRRADTTLHGHPRIGDCVAPRTVHEAVREARAVLR